MKAQEFLAKKKFVVNERIDAKKTRLDRADALRLARSVSKVIVAKGRIVVTFDMKTNLLDDETLLAAILGPTANLRAPTVRKGDVLLVGFNEEMYRMVLS